MKFTVILSAALCFVFGQAQMVNISIPTPGETLTTNQPFKVQLQSMDGLTNFQDVSVAIGILSCGTVPCQNLTGTMGNVIYAGNFTPQRHENILPPYQNFTFTVPNTTDAGNALLTVSHFYLIGAGLEPILETKNTTISISA